MNHKTVVFKGRRVEWNRGKSKPKIVHFFDVVAGKDNKETGSYYAASQSYGCQPGHIARVPCDENGTAVFSELEIVGMVDKDRAAAYVAADGHSWHELTAARRADDDDKEPARRLERAIDLLRDAYAAAPANQKIGFLIWLTQQVTK